MAVGTQAKQEVTQKILETFKGSFIYDKEIRIPVVEDGVQRQIKVTLTCAKVNVTEGGDTEVPGTAPVASDRIDFETMTPSRLEPTEEEKTNIKSMLAALGL